MKTILKIMLVGSVFAAVFCEASVPHLSSEWYGLPENGASVSPDTRLTGTATQAIDTIFEATSEVADNTKVRLLGKDDTVPWYLAYLKTDLGISASGLFGLLVLQGSAAVSFRWEPNPPPYPSRKEMDGPTIIHVSENSSADDIMQQLAPFTDAVIKGGQIQDPKLFHDSLFEQAKEFALHVRSISDVQSDKWWVTGFRLELDVDVSGMVSPALTAGGALNIRFEWDRIQCSSAMKSTPSRDDDLHKLVQAIAEDVSAVSEQDFSDTAYYPHGINLGLGITASGTFGVVSASLAVIGTVLLSNGANPSAMKAESRSDLATIPIIESNPPESHLRYADAEAIPVRGGPVGDVIFDIDRIRFRRGLHRAAGLGHSLAQRATRLHPKKWKVYELAVNYSLGVGASFGLVTVGGQINAEIDFYHRNTP